MNRVDALAHRELSGVVEALRKQPDDIRVLLISAEGPAFSAGGAHHEMLAAHESQAVRERMRREAETIVRGMPIKATGPPIRDKCALV